MSTFQQYISVIGGLQGFLLFVLLVADKRMTTASRLLGGICLLISIVFLVPFLLLSSENDTVGRIIGLLFYLPVAVGPLGYLYSRSAMLKAPLVRRDLLHVLPLLFCYALVADVILAHPEFMAEWITGAQPLNLRLKISEYVPVTIAYAYAIWTLMMIWRYRRRANDNLADFDPSIFIWLLTLQGLSLLVWFLKTLAGLTPAPIALADVANLFLIILIYIIAVLQWRNPQLFTVPNLKKNDRETPAEVTSDDAKSQDGELDSDTRAVLFKTLQTQLETEKLYLDNDLTLSRLSVSTGLSKHHLSEVLNRHAGKNFYEFINGYRVDFVCKRLETGERQSLIDVAFEAGFSSKSTFNAIFKQFTGQTPTQYRKALKLAK